jgi:hypothetical protein
MVKRATLPGLCSVQFKAAHCPGCHATEVSLRPGQSQQSYHLCEMSGAKALRTAGSNQMQAKSAPRLVIEAMPYTRAHVSVWCGNTIDMALPNSRHCQAFSRAIVAAASPFPLDQS